MTRKLNDLVTMLTKTSFIELSNKVTRNDLESFTVDFEDAFDDGLKVTYTRRLYNWKPCVDIEVNGTPWLYNVTIDTEEELNHMVILFNRLSNMEFDHSNTNMDLHRKQTTEKLISFSKEYDL